MSNFIRNQTYFATTRTTSIQIELVVISFSWYCGTGEGKCIYFRNKHAATAMLTIQFSFGFVFGFLYVLCTLFNSVLETAAGQIKCAAGQLKYVVNFNVFSSQCVRLYFCVKYWVKCVRNIRFNQFSVSLFSATVAISRYLRWKIWCYSRK